MVDLAQTIEEWKDLCSVKVDDQVSCANACVYGFHIQQTKLIFPPCDYFS